MPVSRDARLGHAPTLFRRPGDDDGRRNETDSVFGRKSLTHPAFVATTTGHTAFRAQGPGV